MKIMLINPNTTQYMTDSILKCARRYASPGTELYAVTASFGVSSVECYVDEYLAAPAVLREIMEDRDENGQVRVTAARSVLEYGLKMTETTDILTRLDELEAAMGGEHE